MMVNKIIDKRKIKKLIKKYAKTIGISDPRLIEKVFFRGDVFQKKRDLIAMRATIYAKKNIIPGSSYEEQQKIMEEFSKNENLIDAKFPKIKIENGENITRKNNGIVNGGKSQKTSKLSMSKSNLSIKPKLTVGAHNKPESKTHEI